MNDNMAFVKKKTGDFPKSKQNLDQQNGIKI